MDELTTKTLFNLSDLIRDLFTKTEYLERQLDSSKAEVKKLITNIRILEIQLKELKEKKN